MEPERQCTKCGAPLSCVGDEVSCPGCLLEAGLDETQLCRTMIRNFGNYELLEEIARGGMGVVYRARQIGLDRCVAVKLLLSGPLATPEMVQRFRTEATTAASLQHPNIVAIHEVGFCEGQHFIAMDYVAGCSLADIVRDGPLEARRAAAYVKTVAEAIQFAHDRKILHRDLKPSNVLVDESDEPRVTDFGLARRLDAETVLTLSGDVLGSPGYMAPEQAAGRRGSVGPRTDVYALGAILYHLLTGRPPFAAGTVPATLHAVVHTEAVSPRLLVPGLPRDLETICLKCLEKEPGQRYTTAQELADELARVLGGEMIKARPATPPERVWRWAKRKPVLAGAWAVTTAAVALAAAVLYASHRAERQRQAERLQTALDTALVAARTGDLEAAENSIAAAEMAGAFAKDVRMLRGQVAFHRGDYQEALRQLQQAARLSPNSVAAQAMLSLTHGRLGQWTESELAFQKASYPATINSATATPEDLLFRGLAESERDPVRALATLEEAVRRRPSVLAMMTRGQVRTLKAMMTADATEAERAIAELNLVKEMLPNDPGASLLFALLVAANAYAEAGQTNRLVAALSQAEAEAAALKRYSRHFDAVFGRVVYLDYVGQEQAALEELRRATEEMANPILNHLYGLALYRRADFPGALAAMERGGAANGAIAYKLRSFILAELPDGPQRALEEFRRLWQSHSPSLESLPLQTIPRLLGRKSEAVEACRSIRPKFATLGSWRDGWFQRLLDYNCDLIDSTELLKAAEASRWNLSEAHFYIGMTYLADGDRNAARRHFQKCAATRILYSFEYMWSRAFLQRMERDPGWPPWISAKEEP